MRPITFMSTTLI